MAVYKVELCGVNTSSLPLLKMRRKMNFYAKPLTVIPKQEKNI